LLNVLVEITAQHLAAQVKAATTAPIFSIWTNDAWSS
jgi:hypothetical protein